MNQFLVRLAKVIYEGTPFPLLRRFYFNAFSRLCRNKWVQASVDGMTFDLDLGEMIDISLYLGKYEPDMVKAIERYCRPGFTVVDIGANIGAHCLRFSKIVGPAGRVFAFEPTNYAFNKLLRNISLNSPKNVHSFRVALSDRNAPGQNVTFRSSWRLDARHCVESDTVDFVRLDDWCADMKLDRLDIVKLDVDGNEYPILEGASRTIRRFKPIFFMEVGAYHFKDPASNPLEFLSGLGFRFRDSKTLEYYPDIRSIRKILPGTDDKMSFSINIIAETDLPGAG